MWGPGRRAAAVETLLGVVFPPTTVRRPAAIYDDRTLGDLSSSSSPADTRRASSPAGRGGPALLLGRCRRFCRRAAVALVVVFVYRRFWGWLSSSRRWLSSSRRWLSCSRRFSFWCRRWLSSSQRFLGWRTVGLPTLVLLSFYRRWCWSTRRRREVLFLPVLTQQASIGTTSRPSTRQARIQALEALALLAPAEEGDRVADALENAMRAELDLRFGPAAEQWEGNCLEEGAEDKDLLCPALTCHGLESMRTCPRRTEEGFFLWMLETAHRNAWRRRRRGYGETSAVPIQHCLCNCGGCGNVVCGQYRSENVKLYKLSWFS